VNMKMSAQIARRLTGKGLTQDNDVKKHRVQLHKTKIRNRALVLSNTIHLTGENITEDNVFP